MKHPLNSIELEAIKLCRVHDKLDGNLNNNNPDMLFKHMNCARATNKVMSLVLVIFLLD